MLQNCIHYQVVREQKDDYGSFYNGDSYIILNTYKKPDGDVSLYIQANWIFINFCYLKYIMC
jgi:gelsolin